MENHPKITITEPEDQKTTQIVPPLLPRDLCRKRSTDEDKRKIELSRILSENLLEIQREEMHKKKLKALKKKKETQRHSFPWDEDAQNHNDPVLRTVFRLNRSESPGCSFDTQNYTTSENIKPVEKKIEEDTSSEDEVFRETQIEKKKKGSIFKKRSSYSPW